LRARNRNSFDFTEWPGSVRAFACSEAVKRNWSFANSSHVMDLAFFLGGFPASLDGRRAGAGDLDFHPDARRALREARSDC
jgi:hypothetical protein